MYVLVSNVGSTSLKFKLFMMPDEEVVCEAKIERVGSDNAIYTYKDGRNGYSIEMAPQPVLSYAKGIEMFIASLTDVKNGAITNIALIETVGFKTVLAKGFYGVHELTDEVLEAMRAYLFAAPAHNPPYLEAIGQFKAAMPKARMIGVFETAFHITIPLERRIYPLPYEWYKKYGIMRMGYHGASHSFIAHEIKGARIISCHLGGSSSVCAILNGKSVDCSFGFSLQTGIPHTSRAGDFDPYIVPFLEKEGLPREEIMRAIEKSGGLLGISGVSNDMREIQEAASKGNIRAKLAIETLAVSVIRYTGAFYAELGGLDTLVFTGGIGENSPAIREKICSNLLHLGVRIDERKNNTCGGNGNISAKESHVKVIVVPANEELGIARQAYVYSVK